MLILVQSVLPKVRANYKRLSEREINISVDKSNWLKADLYVCTQLVVSSVVDCQMFY